MDHIDQHLATAACNHTYKCIQAAVAMGKKLLNKYYSYTDHSKLYRIAMSEFLSLVECRFTIMVW
jgi:histidinol phosphatase-like PHP family hydrolase